MLKSGYCLRYDLDGKDVLNQQRTAIYANSDCEVVFWPSIETATIAAQELANSMNKTITICTLPLVVSKKRGIAK